VIGGAGDTSPSGSARTLQGARVLVTGGLGFIGSNLAHRLVELNAQVTLVDSLLPQYGGNPYNIEDIRDRVTVNISDVRDAHATQYLVQGADVLFNLAGQTSHLDSMHDPFTDLEINCTSQLSILESCRQFNPGIRIVFASTRQFYGKPIRLPVDESHPLHPADVNGVNKMAGEAYHTLYDEVYGIRCTSLRLTNTYGPRMRIKDARQTFLGVWIRRVLEGEPFEVWGGEQLRDLSYVDDAVDALVACATTDETHGRALNVGGPPPVSLRELADIVVNENGGGSYDVKEFPEQRKRIDIGSYHADYGELTRLVGWEPKVGVAEGVKRTLDYFRSHLEHYL